MFCENWKHRQALPPFTNRINLSSPFPKNLEHAHKVRWCYPFPNRLVEKVGVSNYEAYYSGNLPHIPKLTSSSHVHPFGIKNPKKHCFVNVILQIIYSVLRYTQQKMNMNNCVKGKISECLFDTAHKTPSAQEVETLNLNLQLSTYNSFFTQSPPIICKAPTANRQRRWASYPTLWSTATLDCVATSREKTIIFNQLHMVNHSWSGVSQEKYTFNHPQKPCILSDGWEVELCIWLCKSIWWSSSRCTNFTPHSARLQLRSKRKNDINSVFEL